MTHETQQIIKTAAKSAWRKMPNHLRRSFELADLTSIGTLAVLESPDSDQYITAYRAILHSWRAETRRGSVSQVEYMDHDSPAESRNHRLADIDLALRVVPADIADTARRVLAGETRAEIGRPAYERMRRAFNTAFA